jgi:hypothetical protein
MENTKDLHFYAMKVKFFNNTKKAIREQLTAARDFRTDYAGADEDTVLNPPFTYQDINDTYMGSTESVSNDGADAMMGQGIASISPTNPSSTDTVAVTLESGYTVVVTPNASGESSTVDIYEPDQYPDGDVVTQIWGDPHVNENGSESTCAASEWHYGQDSSFILPDGTMLNMNSEETSSGEWYNVGLNIISGNDRLSVGNTGNGVQAPSQHLDGAGWMAYCDGTNTDGIFYLAEQGEQMEWAKLEGDGNFYDIVGGGANSWANYQNGADGSNNGDFDRDIAVDYNNQINIDGNITNAMQGGTVNCCGNIAELDQYIEEMESQLNSVGDDAQLANVDLQNMLQKQQQTLQMMSNISKMLHDTAMAVIRKMGG